VIARRLVVGWAVAWVAVVLLFAVQWFAYDAARGDADAFHRYLWWSFYTWGVLTPVAIKLALRHPIDAATWKRAVPVHLAAGVAIVIVEISAEALLGKLRMHPDASMLQIATHYFGRHAQLSVLTYGVIVAVVQIQRRALRTARLEAELTAAQLEVLRAQLHPHFLFNTLQAATTLVHDDPDGAEDILLRLGELLRVSLDESNVHEVSLERELEVLELYLGIQARRFGDRLRFELAVEPDVHDCMVPPLILQPIVENAIRHGIGRHKGSDTVTIEGRRHGAFLKLEVRNLSSHLDAEAPRQGVGLANTRARLDQLYGDRQHLELRGLTPSGVCAEIVLPLRGVAAS
jgi:LytS/YehU family sensor histidine kinase